MSSRRYQAGPRPNRDAEIVAQAVAFIVVILLVCVAFPLLAPVP